MTDPVRGPYHHDFVTYPSQVRAIRRDDSVTITGAEYLRERRRLAAYEHALIDIRDELSNGATANWEFIERRFAETLDELPRRERTRT